MTAPEQKMRVVFMGTPDFAATVLRHVAAWPGCEVVAAYCQPDRPAGRGHKLQPPAVKVLAQELGIPEEKSLLLQHMILSHHGEPEFGAAVRPVCAESELLSYIDMIDSRMEIYREVLGATPLGGFSDRVFALDGKKLYHHE